MFELKFLQLFQVIQNNYLCVAEGNKDQRQQVAKDKRAHHVDFPHLVIRPHFPAECAVIIGLHDALVVSDRRRHRQRERPDPQHAEQRVTRHADRRGFPAVHDGHVAVHGHGRQREHAHQHGHCEEVVHKLADEGAQDPRGKYVDSGLEGHAEKQVGQISHAQIKDEDVGGATALTCSAPHQHCDHQRVPHHTEREDQPEHHQRHQVIRPNAKQQLSRCVQVCKALRHTTSTTLIISVHDVSACAQDLIFPVEARASDASMQRAHVHSSVLQAS